MSSLVRNASDHDTVGIAVDLEPLSGFPYPQAESLSVETDEPSEAGGEGPSRPQRADAVTLTRRR